MLGFDIPNLQTSHLSQTALKDLSGDAMAAPSIASALLAVLSSIQDASLFDYV